MAIEDIIEKIGVGGIVVAVFLSIVAFVSAITVIVLILSDYGRGGLFAASLILLVVSLIILIPVVSYFVGKLVTKKKQGKKEIEK
jgi:uncharacterized membrane protein YhaH (DUF805 family)